MISNELVVLIVDDEPKVAEVLKTIIEKKIKAQGRIIVHVANSVKEAVGCIEEHLPDIVFLDIHMPEENGLELFKYVDRSTFEVVFTTAYDQYAIEAINTYNCLMYLLKPIQISAVQKVFEKFKEVETTHNYYKIIKNNQKRYVVRIDDIICCKAADNYCEIYLKNQKFLISKTLKEIEKKLVFDNFKRVNRSFMVNVNHILLIDKEDNTIQFKDKIIVNNEEVKHVITVSPIMTKEFNDLLL